MSRLRSLGDLTKLDNTGYVDGLSTQMCCIWINWNELQPLTHCGRDKMIAILQTTFSNSSLNQAYCFQFHLHSSSNKMQALVQMIVCHTRDKNTLSELLNELRLFASVCKNIWNPTCDTWSIGLLRCCQATSAIMARAYFTRGVVGERYRC